MKTGILGEWIQDIPSQIYTGTAIIPNNVIVINGSTTLTKGVDYNIKNYNNNVNAGMATITIEGIGGYAGFMTKTFSINPRPLTLNETGMTTITIADIPASYNYMGDSIKPDITITEDSKTLILNKDYTVNYSNNVNPGEASIAITGIGNYAGTISKTFEINYPPDWNSIINVNNVNPDGIGYEYNNNLITINQDGYYRMIGTTTNNRVVVQSGTTATIILDSVNITSSNHAFDVSSGSTVALLLKNSNTFQATGSNHAGLHVPFGGTLILSSADGSGSVNGMLTANGGTHGAAIGSGANEGVTGNITIKGGTINAHGGLNGAGIGAGENCSGGAIVIDGGIVNAYGSTHGAAIGGGYNSSNSGSIVINGGVINANSSGGANGAGIGGGTNTNMGSIEISGGIVNAIGSAYGAGIGGGMNGTGGNITIYEGTINASGGTEGAGIGGGVNGSGGNIVIYGGYVIANGGINGVAGIGGGHSGGPGTFLMNGNAVVFASSVSDDSPKTKGILFIGNTGIMYGNVILKQNATIPSGKTWTISSDQIFEIAPNETLTHNGIINNNGAINNFGIIDGTGTIIGNSVIDEDIDEYDNFDTYEVEGKLAVADILNPQADLTGGIIGTIGFDDYYDEDDFYDPMIDVVVIDKETNTVLYEIYIDETTNTYTAKYESYLSPELGDGAEFFPVEWESNDILSSINGIEQFRHEYGYIPSYPYLQDSIDVIVTATVYNSKLNSVKIPGIGYVGFASGSNPSLLGVWDLIFGKNDGCFGPPSPLPPLPLPPSPPFPDISKYPYNIWGEIKSPNTDKNSDLIIAAHRGVWGGALGNDAPENSRSSIQATVGKTSVIEIDVMKTQDNKLVLSHDYTLSRLSEFSGPANTYWFNFDYSEYISDYDLGAVFDEKPHLYKLRKRNGDVNNTNDFYLLFGDMLDLLKKNKLVALVDIKELMKTNINGTCINCEYDHTTPAGRQKIKDSWIDILKRCIEVASKENALDNIAFKTSYKPEELTGEGGISEKQLLRVRYMPMIQPTNKIKWNSKLKRRVIGLIDSWMVHSSHVVAIETNFKTLNDAYLKSFSTGGANYSSLLHYVSSKGLRPGIFSEEPVGPKGVVSRWAKWSMKNTEKDIRGDHLLLMNVPYFNTAVITTDRTDVWQQIQNAYNNISTPLLSANMDALTLLNNPDFSKDTGITANYVSGMILLNGLNSDDLGSVVVLYDLHGRLIYKNKVTQDSRMIIPIRPQSGIYLLKVLGNRQTSIKLIINEHK